MQAINRRRFLAASTLALAGLGLPRPLQSAEPKPAVATGFFRVEQRNGVWWFIKPQGEPVVSLGVNHVEPRLMIASYNRQATLQRYGADFVTENGAFNPEGKAAKKWVNQVVADLQDWGFNALGFHNPLPRPLIRDRIAFSEPVRPINLTPYFPNLEYADVFSPEVAARIEAGARAACEPFRAEPNLIGYVYNDRPIYDPGGGPGGRRLPVHPWVDALRRLPGDRAGKQRWIEVLKQRHADAKSAAACHGVEAGRWEDLLARLDWPARQDLPDVDADHEAFLAVIVDRWYELHAAAIRRHDPNHLILGDKLGGGFAERGARPEFHHNIPPYLYPILKKHVDVVTVEWYGYFEDQVVALRNLHRETGKPILLGDSSFSEVQPRQDGAKGIIVGSQEEVGREYERYLRQAMDEPLVLGWHFCGYIESWTEPGRPSRFQPQNGFKDPFEKVHAAAIVRVRAANQQAKSWHERRAKSGA